MRPALLTELEQRANARGFDLFGVVDAERFDAAQPQESRCARLLPGCGTAIVLASGSASSALPAAMGELLQLVGNAGHSARLASPVSSALSFASLAEAAGFGIVSPVIHRLLHPRFGPWVEVQGALLIEGRPFGPITDASIADRFHPCCQCARPCVAACPAAVHDGHGASQFERCHDHRIGGGCVTGCSVMRSCPVGAKAPSPEAVELQRHLVDLQRLVQRHGRGWRQTLRRWFGPG